MSTRYTVTSERLGEGIRVVADGDHREALDRAVAKRYGKRVVWQPNGAGLQGFKNGNSIIYFGAVWEPVKGGGQNRVTSDCRWRVEVGW